MVLDQAEAVLDNMPVVQQGGAALFAKMARVMGQLKRVPKSARNQHHGYNYASADDVYDAVREALSEANIAFFPTFVHYRQERLENSKQIRTWATFDFTFACGDTGAIWTCRWDAEADDTQDKGLNKVATAAVKYFLLKTFVLSTGESDKDDPDTDGDAPIEDKGGKKQGKPERRIPTDQPAPAPSGRKQTLRQQLAQAVKHPYYNSEGHLNNAVSKLFEADILHESMELDRAVKLVESLGTLRENNTSPEAAIEAVRKIANDQKQLELAASREG